MNVSKSSNIRARTIKSDGKSLNRKRKRGNYNGSRGSRFGRTVGSRVDNYVNFGSQVMRDLNSIRRFINTEVHFLDTVQTAVNMTSTPTFVLLNGMAIGDTSITRTGQSIKMDRLDLRFYMTGNITAVQTVSRIIVVLDKQCNGAIFSATSLLNAATAVSPYTVGGQNRFVILYDQTYALSTAGPLNMVQCLTLPANQHVEYNTGTAGDITDINTNSLYLLFLSDQATNVPILTAYLRLWFIDN
jgi:hypothetical protein